HSAASEFLAQHGTFAVKRRSPPPGFLSARTRCSCRELRAPLCTPDHCGGGPAGGAVVGSRAGSGTGSTQSGSVAAHGVAGMAGSPSGGCVPVGRVSSAGGIDGLAEAGYGSLAESGVVTVRSD